MTRLRRFSLQYCFAPVSSRLLPLDLHQLRTGHMESVKIAHRALRGGSSLIFGGGGTDNVSLLRSNGCSTGVCCWNGLVAERAHTRALTHTHTHIHRVRMTCAGLTAPGKSRATVGAAGSPSASLRRA